MFNQKYNLKYPYLFLMCFLISTTLLLNSCRRFILKDEGVEDKSIEELSDLSRAKTNLDGLNTSIYTIRQTLGSDGLLTGSFLVTMRQAEDWEVPVLQMFLYRSHQASLPNQAHGHLKLTVTIVLN